MIARRTQILRETKSVSLRMTVIEVKKPPQVLR
jgi:hypothetical protein